MDLGDLTQIVLVVTVAATLGRVGFALARLIERRAATPSPLPAAVEDRIQRLEDEYGALRQDVAEIQERQDFTERALLRESDVSRGEVPTPR